jgi:hypothetical protein
MGSRYLRRDKDLKEETGPLCALLRVAIFRSWVRVYSTIRRDIDIVCMPVRALSYCNTALVTLRTKVGNPKPIRRLEQNKAFPLEQKHPVLAS